MKHYAITALGGVYGVFVKECPDSPRCRYVIIGKTKTLDERGRLVEMTVYLHQGADDVFFWYRCAEFDGKPTAYFDSRDVAEKLLCAVAPTRIPAPEEEEEPDELPQAA